jgi:hypothetical protein
MDIEWNIDDQPAAYQIEYWKRQFLVTESQLKAEQKRKEPDTLVALEKELRQARKTIEYFKQDSAGWKKVAGDLANRVALLESDSAVVVLKRERDHWRNSWRNCTRRLADKIEHLGLNHTGKEPNADAP